MQYAGMHLGDLVLEGYGRKKVKSEVGVVVG